MKKIISKLIILLILFFVMLSCEETQKKEKGDYFYPNVSAEYFHVNYQKDTITITEKYKFKKYKYTADSTIFLGEVNDKRSWILAKKNDDYYLKFNGCYELFMSNKEVLTKRTFNDEMGGLTYSIRIERIGTSLYESTLYINTTKTHRNPLLFLIYDKSYKIRNIKSGTLYVDYTIQEK